MLIHDGITGGVAVNEVDLDAFRRVARGQAARYLADPALARLYAAIRAGA
jgi:hypothetical protein